MKRIRYISEFTLDLSAAEIDEITRRSIENTGRDGITGVLVASGRLFFQLLEGPDEMVDACYARILRDTRHGRVHLIGSEQGDLRRLCPDWAMNKLDLSQETESRFEPIRTLLRVVIQQRDVMQEVAGVLERVMWHELIAAEPVGAGLD